jgi:pilus assembly protein FimV
VVGDAPAAPIAAPPPGPHESTSVFDSRREVSVEELIDLEQQADFFVVLGQDDAAIDLLMGHVQGTGGASPLPYLKLLEIHRRRDERDAYDRVRDRFNRRFGAFAPEWEAHSGHDRALEDYPAEIERLQGVWPEPAKAMEVLSGLLFQRDLNAQTFDLPAYGELLFLYSLARERAEHEPPPDGVDLLLPLEDESPAPAVSSGRPSAVGLAAAVGAAGAAGAAFSAVEGLPAFDDPLSLEDLPGPVPETLPTYPVPLSGNPPARQVPPPNDLLDLNISDDPAEPKGPLSKW